MKRQETMSIGDVLRMTLEENDMTSRLDEFKAIDLWAGIVGEHIAGHTGRPTVSKGVMTVRVPSAPLRHELSMSRSAFTAEFNRLLGRRVIHDSRFTS